MMIDEKMHSNNTTIQLQTFSWSPGGAKKKKNHASARKWTIAGEHKKQNVPVLKLKLHTKHNPLKKWRATAY